MLLPLKLPRSQLGDVQPYLEEGSERVWRSSEKKNICMENTGWTTEEICSFCCIKSGKINLRTINISEIYRYICIH